MQSFLWAIFAGYAGFVSTKFAGDAWFDLATFSEKTAFAVRATFSGSAIFTKAVFEKDTDFFGAKVVRDFDLSETIFTALPAFNQGSFGENLTQKL